jgi:hypothetical protein
VSIVIGVRAGIQVCRADVITMQINLTAPTLPVAMSVNVEIINTNRPRQIYRLEFQVTCLGIEPKRRLLDKSSWFEFEISIDGLLARIRQGRHFLKAALFGIVVTRGVRR